MRVNLFGLFLLFLFSSKFAYGYSNKVASEVIEISTTTDKPIYDQSDTIHIVVSIENVSSKKQLLYPYQPGKKDRFCMSVYAPNTTKRRIYPKRIRTIRRLTIEPGEIMNLEYELTAHRVLLDAGYEDSQLVGGTDTLEFNIQGPWIQRAPITRTDLAILTTWTKNYEKISVHTRSTLLEGSFSICTAKGDQYGNEVAWGGTNFLVVWSDGPLVIVLDGPDPPKALYAQLVSAKGVLIDTNFLISPATHIQGVTGVASNGTNYLVVWWDLRDTLHRSGKIYGQLVSNKGTLIGSDFLISLSEERAGIAAVASNSTNYLVAWDDSRNSTRFDHGDVYGQVVSSDGTLIGTNFPICEAPKTQDGVTIASDSRDYLVAWEDGRNRNSDIYGQLVSGNGTLIDTSFPIANTKYSEDYPAVAWGGVSYLAVWGERFSDTSGVYGQLISKAGRLIDSRFPIAASWHLSWNPSFVCVSDGGASYLVAWEESSSSGISGRLVSHTGILSSPIFGVPGYRFHHPSVAGVDNRFLVVWTEEKDSDIYGIIVNDSLISKDK